MSTMMPGWQEIVSGALGIVQTLGIMNAITAVVMLSLAGAFLKWVNGLRS